MTPVDDRHERRLERCDRGRWGGAQGSLQSVGRFFELQPRIIERLKSGAIRLAKTSQTIAGQVAFIERRPQAGELLSRGN